MIEMKSVKILLLLLLSVQAVFYGAVKEKSSFFIKTINLILLADV